MSLDGKRILVTRAAESSDGLATLLRERGAEVVLAPAIETLPIVDAPAIDAAIATLTEGTRMWLTFTSRTAVVRFDEELRARGHSLASIGRDVRVAVVGPGTAKAVIEAGLSPPRVATEHHGDGLADLLLREAKVGERVVLPRAKVAREVLPERLRAAGIGVDVVVVYETAKPAPEKLAHVARALRDGSIDAVTLTSSSTATHLVDVLGDEARSLLAGCVVASIGPVTTLTAESLGLQVAVTADPHTLEGLSAALEAYFRGR